MNHKTQPNITHARNTKLFKKNTMKLTKLKTKQNFDLLLCREEAKRPTQGGDFLQRNLIMISMILVKSKLSSKRNI